jgi:hypothetical protein
LAADLWPALSPAADWADTRETLHMWTQVVGKIRMAQTPLTNHWWNVTLYVTPRGLTTSPMPWNGEAFAIDFDFIAHQLLITTSAGDIRTMELTPRSVADFHRELMGVLAQLGIHPRITTMPQEVENAIPFDQDTKHASYDAEMVHRFWRAMLQADRVLKIFRARFRGKASPVHFFWGSFDLAVTRFSGRPAPPREFSSEMEREAYCDECCSAGWWPGGGKWPQAAFYSYAAPEPAGFAERAPRYNPDTHLCELPYEIVRTSQDPDDTVLDFCQSVYDVAAELGGWSAGVSART